MMNQSSREPRCGMCGYPVRGLPTFRCPECGNDLRMVGITVVGASAHLNRWQRIGCWTVLFAIAALPLWILARNLIPPRTTVTWGLMAPRAAYDIKLVASSGWVPGRGQAELSLRRPAAGRMTIRHSLAYSADRAGDAPTGPVVTEAVIEAWLADHGVAPTPMTRLEALDLLAIVKAGLTGELSTRPPLYFQQHLGNQPTHAEAVDPRLILAALAALWAVGAWVAWRRSPGARPAQSSIA